MRNAHISHHRGAMCPFISARRPGRMLLNRDSTAGVTDRTQIPRSSRESDGVRDHDPAGGSWRDGSGLVAVRSRVPGLARLAGGRGPALRAAAQVEPAQGRAGQEHWRPSRPDPAGGTAPVASWYRGPSRRYQRRRCAPPEAPGLPRPESHQLHQFAISAGHLSRLSTHSARGSHGPAPLPAQHPRIAARGALAARGRAAKLTQTPAASVNRPPSRWPRPGQKRPGILCKVQQSCMQHELTSASHDSQPR